jgi:AcrR family transcriptional regulator
LYGLGVATAASPTERGERSRRAILDAAFPIFARAGYAAASLNQIIEASGLTKGGFYFHYPSKQALALAVVADHNERSIARVSEEIARYDKAVDRLFAAPRLLARYAGQGRGPAALGKLIEELARDPDVRDDVRGTLHLWIDTVAEQFAAAQAEGTIRDDLDAAVLAQVAIGGFTGMQVLTDQLGDGRFEQRVEAFITVVELATLTRPRRTAARKEANRHGVRRDHRGGKGRRRDDGAAPGE